MKQNAKWSISTFKIYLEYINPDMAGEFVNNKPFIKDILNDLILEHQFYVENYGPKHTESLAYEKAVKEIKESL